MTRRQARPSVTTIPPSVPFVDALAASLLERYGSDPLALSRVRVLLPNRRSLRSLRDALLRASGGQPILLPRLSPIGDVDEDAFAFSPGIGEGLTLPPAISETRRLFLLAKLVMRWKQNRGEAMPPAGALRLARELAGLIDSVHTEGLDFADLEDLVPEELASHWQITLEFLEIVSDQWPDILAAEGAIDPADRRNRLIRALIARWRAEPPETPVIAAGSTGSIPATADLLALVARLDRGTVILPGFDRDMDEETWEAIGPGHPQFLMRRLLDRMGVAREEVAAWPLEADSAARKDARAPRMEALTAALEPAATLGRRRPDPERPREAVRGLTRIDAPGPREEAGAIALAMREVLETPGKTAALITHDRRLARRVRAELVRWEIAVDDSAGDPAGQTAPGVFLRLLARAAAAGFAPSALLALLKHPLAAGGGPPQAMRRLARAVDRQDSRAHGPLLRGPKPAPGIDALLAAAKGAGLPGKWYRRLEAVLELLRPLETVVGAEAERSLRDLMDVHLRVAEALAASDTQSGGERLWRGPAGEALAETIADINAASAALPPIAGARYPGVFEALLESVRVRPPYGGHPRLAILGPIEARLHHADRMILGGLNEGSWPPATDHDPWMNRKMRADFGLPALERRIGQAAHDFLQAAGAPEVILTRAQKEAGTPSLESRWLSRLAVMAPKLPGGERLLAIYDELDQPREIRPSPPPAPRPPVEKRPKTLSVTQVELWMRDPYALYARHVLGLEPLSALEADPAAPERGIAMHAALDAFMRRRSGRESREAALALLEECGKAAFGPLLERPAVWAFWWPRFQAVAARFLEIQAEREAEFETPGTEIFAELAIEAAIPFTLRAKADRIDRCRADKSLEIVDYKTGTPPSKKRVEAGFAPQLPLEGWMAQEGAFTGLDPAAVRGLAFWQLRGTREPIGIQVIADPERHIRAAAQGLKRLIAQYAREETPYLSNPRPAFTGYGEYDHLARIREWQALPALEGGDSAAGEREE